MSQTVQRQTNQMPAWLMSLGRERSDGEGACKDLHATVRGLEAKLDQLATEPRHDLDPTPPLRHRLH